MKKGIGVMPLLLCAALALSTTCVTTWRRAAHWISKCWCIMTSPAPSADYAAISRLLHPVPVTATPTRRAVRPTRDQRPWIERLTLQRNTFAY